MSKLPSRQVLLSAAILSSLVVTGCDVDSGSTMPVATQKAGTPTPAVPGCTIIETATGACALVLTTPDVDGTPGPDFYVPGTHPRFNPAAADIPLNTDIPFAGSTDGTAKFDNPSNAVHFAINRLDGWSTTAAFDIAFSDAIDPASVNDGSVPATVAQQNVFLVPLETLPGKNPLKFEDLASGAALFSVANIAATKFTAQAISLDGGTNNVLRISPTSPLLPGKKYIVIITKGISNAAGRPIAASASYELLGAGNATACEDQGINAALFGLCDVIGAWERIAHGYFQLRSVMLGAAAPDAATVRESLALTYTFTTTSPVSSLIAHATPFGALVSQGLPAAQAAGLVMGFQAGVEVPTPRSRSIGFYDADVGVAVDGVVNGTDIKTFLDPDNDTPSIQAGQAYVYQGHITLPYYLDAPGGVSAAELSKVVMGTWSVNRTLGDMLLDLKDNGLSDGSTSYPTDSDGSYNLTWQFPFALRKSNVTVPLLVVLPDNRSSITGGYPVSIFVHGITGDRTNMLPVAYALAANANTATVAIDLPLHGVAPATSFGLNTSSYQVFNVDHGAFAPLATAASAALGERHFDLARNPTTLAPQPMWRAGDTGAAVPAVDTSGVHFINLGSFLTSRDNMRQAVSDLLNLNASLGRIDIDGDSVPDLDTGKVHVVGHSLGGILGTVFVATNNSTAVQQGSAGLQATVNSLNPANTVSYTLPFIDSATFFAPGGQVTKLLENSPAFAPQIIKGLAAQSTLQGSANFEKFMYVMQSVVDNADPINFARQFTSDTSAMNTNLLYQEIVGTAPYNVQRPDLVVPNEAVSGVYESIIRAANSTDALLAEFNSIPAPLAGTEPLLLQAGVAADTNAPEVHGATVKAAVRFNAGHHSSILYPSASGPTAVPSALETAVNLEILAQLISLVSTVNDPTVSPYGMPTISIGSVNAGLVQ